MSESIKPLFETGHIVSTPGALAVLETNGVNPLELLLQHRVYGTLA